MWQVTNTNYSTTDHDCALLVCVCTYVCVCAWAGACPCRANVRSLKVWGTASPHKPLVSATYKEMIVVINIMQTRLYCSFFYACPSFLSIFFSLFLVADKGLLLCCNRKWKLKVLGWVEVRYEERKGEGSIVRKEVKWFRKDWNGSCGVRRNWGLVWCCNHLVEIESCEMGLSGIWK